MVINMVETATCGEFLTRLASDAPTPGGGGASALCGAIGAALVSMVANLTSGRKRYAEYQADIERILVRAEQLRVQLLKLADRDAEVFEPLSKAYGLPTDTDEQKAHKEAVMEAALYAACLVPIELLERAVEVLALHEELVVKGSRLLISDVGVGAAALRAAISGASLNVYINTKSMKNAARAAELNAKADGLVCDGTARCDKVFDAVLAAVRK